MRVKALLHGIRILGKLLERLRPMSGPPNLNRQTWGETRDPGEPHKVEEQANRARKQRAKGDWAK